MKSILTLVATGLALLALGIAFTVAPQAQTHNGAAFTAKDVKIPVLNDSNFYKTVKDSKTIVVVDFYADWCGPCKQIAPSIQQLANEFNGKVLVVKVNVDHAPDVSKQEGIRSIPTVAVFLPGSDKASDRMIGAQTYETYKSWIENHLRKNPGK